MEAFHVCRRQGRGNRHRRGHRLLADRRRGPRDLPALSLAQIAGQLSLAVDRVMAEASLYDPILAALAVKQARGDMIEAIFLLRAYRTTLPRLAIAQPLETAAMQIERRVSATYKDLPGGQLLGPPSTIPTVCSIPILPAKRRSLRPPPAAPSRANRSCASPTFSTAKVWWKAMAASARIMWPATSPASRWTSPCRATRGCRFLARGDEGFLLALAYSTQRGYGRTHPFVGEIRIRPRRCRDRTAGARFFRPARPHPHHRMPDGQPVQGFGQGAAAVHPRLRAGLRPVGAQGHGHVAVDRALRADEFGEDIVAPAQDQEFVLSHADNVQATGFVEHLKLPHYVDFQAELDLVRRMRAEYEAKRAGQAGDEDAITSEAAQ